MIKKHPSLGGLIGLTLTGACAFGYSLTALHPPLLVISAMLMVTSYIMTLVMQSHHKFWDDMHELRMNTYTATQEIIVRSKTRLEITQSWAEDYMRELQDAHGVPKRVSSTTAVAGSGGA